LKRAGSVAEQESRAACKGIHAIDRRQRPTPGVGAASGDIPPAEQVTPVAVFLTIRVADG